MAVPTAPGSELERAAHPAHVGAMLSDDEIRRTYRIAEALWQSGAYKDLKNAEAAFAKMVIGRDLGLSPAQSMQGIHLVEGGVQMHYAMLGTFVRSRPGYDYRPGWIKRDPLQLDLQGREPTAEEAAQIEAAGTPVVVWHDEEEPDDFREIIGAIVDFTVGGERRGVSRFTLDDARQAQLIKDSAKAAWNTSPRNMLLARAMSNGVKWYVPEVLGGLPIYVDGELDARERKSLTAPVADGDDAGQGIDLGPDVEKLIVRATELGHRGLSNRAAVEMAVGGRSPSTVKDWVGRAREELARFAKEKAEAEEAASSPEGAEAGGASGEAAAAPEAPEERDVVPEETVSGEVVPEPEQEGER